jgi:RNA polymerase sigma factor (sigma-70 family)
MEVSTLKYHGGLGLHARSPLLRLQSDERLIAFVRRGNVAAFETLVGRYESRLLAFCRHLLGSREDAEDILQEVFAAAFNAILADNRPIKVRPWLYRIARNRSLNHLRRNQPVGVDSMDVHFSENGASTADKAHDREEFRLLVGDIHDLPETQRTALTRWRPRSPASSRFLYARGYRWPRRPKRDCCRATRFGSSLEK